MHRPNPSSELKKRRNRNSPKFSQRPLLTATMLSGSMITACLLASHVSAQMQVAHTNIGRTNGAPFSEGDPVTFQADSVSYDAKGGIVTWTGNVQIWQNDHVLRADKVSFNRTTNIAVAEGNVAMVEPDGEILFTQYTELGEGMREGVMGQIYALLADDGKLAANGARRTGGKVHDLSRSVYTACPICAKDPKKPPFWQIRAYQATRDMEHQRIDYSDAFIDIMGVPVFYLPFFSMVDPSVKRKSGFLMPNVSWGNKYLGVYGTIPYYWAINNWSDMTLTPLFSSKTGPQLTANYRARFNQGMLRAWGAVAYDTLHQDKWHNNSLNRDVDSYKKGVQGYFFLKTEWALNKYWRYGANINVASSANYMRDYRVNGYGNDMLPSTLYLEGFGEGSYSKVDMQAFQGLNRGVINDSELPFVLPRYTYSYFGQPDAWGGRFSLNTTDFIISRSNGVSDQRGEVALNWDRPFNTNIGQKWLLTLHVDSNIYRGSHLSEMPLYSNRYYRHGSHVSGQVLPTIAMKMNWPFMRQFHVGDSVGTQVLEPIIQLIAAPNSGNSLNRLMPNEDSLNYEFTDSTLFSLNRFQGTDRLDSGARANIGVHGNWIWNGHQVDFLVGQSYQAHIQKNLLPRSGLNHHMSDVVARLKVSPVNWINFTTRTRVDPNTGNINFGDAIFTAGIPHFGISGGYVWQPNTPYYYYYNRLYNYNNRRNDVFAHEYFKNTSELTMGLSTAWDHWHGSLFGRRSLDRGRFAAVGGTVGYQNDCFGLDTVYLKQYTIVGGEQNSQTVLFMFTFKTLGTFGMNG